MSSDTKKVEGKSIVQGSIQGAAVAIKGLSIFGGSGSGAATGMVSNEVKVEKATEKLPQDIPKEELMALCMKLNKRMQSMESKGKELFRKKSILVEERKHLVEIIASTVSISIAVQEDQDLDIEFVKDSWRQWEEQRRQQVLTLEQRISEVEQESSKAKSILEAKHRKELADLQQLLRSQGASKAYSLSLHVINYF